MNEPTHKIVNGIRINLTSEEIEKIKEDWKISELKSQDIIQNELKKEQAKVAIKDKFKLLGFSEDEITLIKIG